VRNFDSTVDYIEIAMLDITIPASGDTLRLQYNKIAFRTEMRLRIVFVLIACYIGHDIHKFPKIRGMHSNSESFIYI
jgi:hypothetical protein